MNTHQLIEMAVLDALGLLEPAEIDAFERAFAEAPEPVRSMVRAEQDRLADVSHLLPDAEPTEGLRDMVLAAVRNAMRAETEPVAGRIQGRPERTAGTPAQPRLKPVRRVSPVWRAASIGLAAAVIVLGAFVLRIGQYDAQAGKQALFTQIYETVGAQVFEDMLFDHQTRRVAMLPTENDADNAAAAVFYNPDWHSARLFFRNLRSQNPGETFRLVVLDEEGNIVREIHTFESDGQFADVPVEVDLLRESSLAIMKNESDTPVLSGNI